MAMPMAAAAARAYGVATPPGGYVSFACAAMATTRTGARRAAAAVVVLSHASGGGGGRGPRGGGEREEEPTDASSSWLVDEDMATLRRRIREAREAEEEEGYGGGGGGGLPAEWTELERRHHGSYVAGVRGAVGLLQVVLVSAQPGLGAGLLALLLLGVPASVLLVSAQLLAVASAVLSGT